MSRPSPYRYGVAVLCSIAALWMYIDRTCFSTVSGPVMLDLQIDDSWKPDLLGAFFLTYALLQIPIGSLADRFGPRLVLTGCIAGWSAVVAATAFVDGLWTLLALRLALGAAEAGAYPAAAALVKRWAGPNDRAVLSSIVAVGGRIGGGIAPVLTSSLALATAGWTVLGPRHPEVEGNWRAVFLIFGLCGLAVAGLFWLFVRDHPPGQAAEPETAAPLPPWTVRLAVVARSRNMWVFGGMQFLINLGWAFLLTMLPSYLETVHNATLDEVGRMQSVPLLVGLGGMLCGGVLSDALTRWIGRRWGRSLPLFLTLCACAAAYLCCVRAADPWVVIAALSVMAFCVDLSNPSVWAFAQDVGGRYTGASLGWGNMLGNLGAYCSPKLFAWVAAGWGWDVVFTGAAATFVLAAGCGLMLNADRPLQEPRPAG